MSGSITRIHASNPLHLQVPFLEQEEDTNAKVSQMREKINYGIDTLYTWKFHKFFHLKNEDDCVFCSNEAQENPIAEAPEDTSNTLSAWKFHRFFHLKKKDDCVFCSNEERENPIAEVPEDTSEKDYDSQVSYIIRHSEDDNSTEDRLNKQTHNLYLTFLDHCK